MSDTPTVGSRLRVGHMPYANSLVFYSEMSPNEVELVTLPPRNMADAMAKGQLDAGPIPIYEVLKMGDTVVPIGTFGVATDGDARSVLLFSEVSADRLGGKRIAITSHTSTSVQLLRVLAREHWHIDDIRLVSPTEGHEAMLVIGDAALSMRSEIAGEAKRYRYVYDLAGEWKSLTGMPFVFARWVARKGADIAKLETIVTASYRAGIAQIDRLSRSVSIEGYSHLNIGDYIRNFIYELGPPELSAIEEFRIRLGTLEEWEPPVMPYLDTELTENLATP